MRVVMLSWEYPPRIVGGISPHVSDLSQQLAAKGVEVHVVTKATPLAPDEQIEDSGVQVHRVHLDETPRDFIHEIELLNLATERRVRKLLENWRPGGAPTIFHAHDWLSLDSARKLKYEYMLPVVATVHATEEGRNNGVHTEIQRFIHEQEYWLTYEAWRVIVCSQFMKREVVRSFNCPEDKADVIFNGVDAEKFRTRWNAEDLDAYRDRFALPDEEIVMFVGRFVREKGIQILLSAAATVIAERPKTKFLLVGRNNNPKLAAFVRWLGLDEKVLFTGFMSDTSLHQLYKVADVAAFPSLYEPFGIVALEAMAAGVPVVAGDAGGLPEVVLHDQTGTLSYAGNAESLSWAILKVLSEPERARKLAEAAQKRLDEEFHWSRLADQTIDVYDQVWAEFLQSYWAEGTVWPVSPGAEERAEARLVAAKSQQLVEPEVHAPDDDRDPISEVLRREDSNGLTSLAP